MCLPLIARVVAVEGDLATVTLLEGETVRVNPILQPDVAPGEYVLLDRGLIIETIAVDQVEEMLRFYAELGEMWAQEDGVDVRGQPVAG